jgi:hypothetical protein
VKVNSGASILRVREVRHIVSSTEDVRKGRCVHQTVFFTF